MVCLDLMKLQNPINLNFLRILDSTIHIISNYIKQYNKHILRLNSWNVSLKDTDSDYLNHSIERST